MRPEAMTWSAEADVVGPSVSADDPHAFLHQIFGQAFQLASCCGIDPGQLVAQFLHAFALRKDARFGGLVGAEYRISQFAADHFLQLPQQLAGLFGMLVDADAESQPELGIVLEQRVAPCRTAPVAILAIGRGRKVAAIDRRTTGGVGHDHAVAEQLAGQADVGRFAATDASRGKLE